MSNIENENFRQDLSKDLIRQLSNIIDGNHVSRNDLKPIQFESDIFTAQFYIEWIFFSEYKDSRVAGGSYRGKRCNSISELENVTYQLDQRAKFDKELRTPFIQSLKKHGRTGILKSDQKYAINNFGEFSAQEVCQTCDGSCKTRCRSCGGNGKQRCSYCSGSGSVTQSRYNSNTRIYENYSSYCSNCGGSGNRNCSGCSGSGKVRCSNCQGHGYFIITRDIIAKAKPIYLLRTKSSLVNQELQDYLDNQSLNFIYRSIYFELHAQEASGDDKETFVYQGESVVSKQDFSVKSKVGLVPNKLAFPFINVFSFVPRICPATSNIPFNFVSIRPYKLRKFLISIL